VAVHFAGAYFLETNLNIFGMAMTFNYNFAFRLFLKPENIQSKIKINITQ